MADCPDVVEVSPRDGLQNEKQVVATSDKLRLIHAAAAAGMKRLEVASFVNPRKVPQMADAEEVLKGLGPPDGTERIGLVMNARGFERARAAGCTEVNFVVVASETFNLRNQGVAVSVTLDTWADVAQLARDAGLRSSVTIGASFGCPFEGEIPLGRVLELADRILAHHPYELAFADTIGCGVPSQVRPLLEGVRALDRDVRLRCHFHNTRGTGLANAAAAIEAGVQALDSSIGGLGGCPFAPAATGNIATEDLVYMLDRMGLETGIDLDRLIATGQWLETLLGRRLPGALLRAGPFPAPIPA